MSYTKQESKLCSGNNIFFFFSFLTLQYCIHFAIYQHESAKGIHMFPILNPPPSPYHPSGSSQCISPKHPVSCIEPGLATRFIYDTIHVSMPFSQIIPPSPSPTEFKRLFYTSVSLLLSCIQGYCLVLMTVPHSTCLWDQHSSAFLWPIAILKLNILFIEKYHLDWTDQINDMIFSSTHSWLCVWVKRPRWTTVLMLV